MLERLTIWCDAGLSGEARQELLQGGQEHTVQFGGSGAEGALLARAHIAFGQPDPHKAAASKTLQWVHLTSAGYAQYEAPEIRKALQKRGVRLTNSSSVYSEPCAQHLLAFMLASARLLLHAATDSLGPRSWAHGQQSPAAKVLQDETVLILGFDAIGRRLAELLSPFGLRVIAIRPRAMGDEIVEVRPVEDVASLLPLADHVVNILPSNLSTEHFVDAELLARTKPGSKFYNVGRGTMVDHAALFQALVSGHLACAYLHVTEPEPLPPDHILWTAPNCFITPDMDLAADQKSQRLVRLFLKNLRRFEANEPLLDQVI